MMRYMKYMWGAAMRKVILMLLLIVAYNSSAMAEWVRVASFEEEATCYVDRTTLLKVENRVKMWFLLDFRKAQKLVSIPYLSVLEQYEFDCKEEQSRRLYFSLQSKNMGGGDMVYKYSDAGKWESNPPGSGGELLWKAACGRPL